MDNITMINQPWWVLAVAGAVSVLFGLAAFFWPGITILVLVWLYGAYALVYGIAQLVGMFRAIGQGATWWTHLLVGLISIAAGIFALAYPLMSTVLLLFVIAFWAIAIGLVEMVSGLAQAQFLLLVVGLVSILFGLLLLSNPGVGALALVWTIGAFSIVRGVLLLVGAVRAPEVAGGAP